MPIPLRKKKTSTDLKSVQIIEYKNQRKMTADEEIEELLNLPPNDSFMIPIELTLKQEEKEPKFFEELIELDFVLPMSEKRNQRHELACLGL